jgi:pilus assembly protein Flp/PilA
VGTSGRFRDETKFRGWVQGREEESGVTAIRRFLKDESGATAIEYGLIAALISIVVITGALSVGGSLGDLYNMVSSKVTGAIP